MSALNEGLSCPDGYDALTEDDVIECDICHRLIAYWHFHTLPPPSDSQAVGSGLDCCNVCRFRFDAALEKAPRSKVVKLSSVYRNGKPRQVALAATIRFYCVGMASKKALSGKSGPFMRKMLDHEKNPRKVPPSEWFVFTDDCPVVVRRVQAVQKDEGPLRSQKNATRAPISANCSVESGVEPRAKKSRSEVASATVPPVALPEESGAGAAPALVFLNDDDCESSHPPQCTPLAHAHVQAAPSPLVAEAFAGGPVEDETPLSTLLPVPLTAESASMPKAPMGASVEPQRSLGKRSVLAKQTSVASRRSRREPTPSSDRARESIRPTPEFNSNSVPAPDVNESSVLAPDVNERSVLAPDVNERSVPAPDVSDCASAPDVNESSVLAPDVNESSAPAPDVNERSVPAPDVSDCAPALEMGVGSAPAQVEEADSDNVADAGEECDAEVLAEETTCQHAAGEMDELMAFFDGLIPQYGMPAAPEPDSCGTNFILHESFLGESARAEAGEGFVPIGEEGRIAGLRLSGSRALVASWVPTTPGRDAFLSVLVLSEQSNYLPIYRVALGERGELAVHECVYTVVLGRRQPSGMEWVTIPEIHSKSSNRMGACSIIRDGSVFTMMLPFSAADADEAAFDEPALTAEVVGYSTVGDSVISAKWSPNVKSLDDLRLFVQSRSGAVTIFRHRREEDVSLMEASQNTTDKMRMFPEMTIPFSMPLHGGAAHLSSAPLDVGFVRGKMCVAWARGGELVMVSNFNRETQPHVTNRVLSDCPPSVNVVAVAGNGVALAAMGGVWLVRISATGAMSAKEELLSSPIGVAITSLVPAGCPRLGHGTQRFVLGTSLGQLFVFARSSFASFASVLEMLCTPSPSSSCDTDVDIRTGFDLGTDRSDANGLMAAAFSSRPDMLKEPADIFFRVSVASEGYSLGVGMGPEGSLIIFSFEIGGHGGKD